MQPLVRGQSGFSLVEMCVTMGIMGIIIMGSMSAIDIIEREKKLSMSSMSPNDLKTTLQGQLGNRDLCSAMMGVAIPTSFNPGAFGSVDITIYRADGTTPWLVPAPLAGQNRVDDLFIENVRFKNESGALPTRTADSPAGHFRYVSGNIELTVRNLAKAGTGTYLIKVPITLKINRLSADRLLACKLTNPDERQPIDLPACNPGEMVIYDDATLQWKCADVPGMPP